MGTGPFEVAMFAVTVNSRTFTEQSEGNLREVSEKKVRGINELRKRHAAGEDQKTDAIRRLPSGDSC